MIADECQMLQRGWKARRNTSRGIGKPDVTLTEGLESSAKLNSLTSEGTQQHVKYSSLDSLYSDSLD